jgi:lambda repressor-like predicted transcriptional regulator
MVNQKTNLHIDSLNTKLGKLNCKLKNAWFRGQNRPYKRILAGLKKQGYDLTNYADKGCDRKELYIQLENEWNMEEVNKIKNIIINILFVEPKVCISHLPDGKEVTSMIWADSKYDAYVYQSGFDELIHLSFETK